jgi:ankyrin repeat protein
MLHWVQSFCHLLINMRHASRPSNDRPTLLHHYLSELHVNWYFVRNKLNESPEDARILTEYGATPLFKALYRRTGDYPTLPIVKQLIDAYPPAIWDDNPNQSCLKAACWRRASIPILQLLLSSRPSRANDTAALCALWKSHVTLFGDEDLMSTVMEGGREGAEIWTKLYMLLQFCTSQTMETYQCLHTLAARTDCPMELLELGLSLFPEQVREADRDGRLPLHHCVFHHHDDDDNGSEQIAAIRLLLEAYPEATTIRDDSCLRLPLHIAIAEGQSWESLQLLLETPDTWSELDGITRLYPFQLAACTEACSLSVVFDLLRTAPYLVQDGTEAGAAARAPLSALKANSSAARLGILEKDVLRQRNEDKLVEWGFVEDPMLWTNVSKLFAHRPPEPDWYVVHTAASLPTCPMGLLQLAVTLHPQELSIRDATGSLPLHLVIASAAAASTNSTRTLAKDTPVKDSIDSDNDTARELTPVEIVLKQYPRAAQLRDGQGRPPLQMALHAGHHPWASLKALIRAHPRSICRRDEQGLYPFQLAAAVKANGLNEIYELLLTAPHLVHATNNGFPKHL